MRRLLGRRDGGPAPGRALILAAERAYAFMDCRHLAADMHRQRGQGLALLAKAYARAGEASAALARFRELERIPRPEAAQPLADAALPIIRMLLDGPCPDVEGDRLDLARRAYRAYKGLEPSDASLGSQLQAAARIAAAAARRLGGAGPCGAPGPASRGAALRDPGGAPEGGAPLPSKRPRAAQGLARGLQEVWRGLLAAPPSRACIAGQIGLATEVLGLWVCEGSLPHAMEAHEVLMGYWGAAVEPLMDAPERGRLRSALEPSWSESCLGLIGMLAEAGRHRDAHIIYQSLFDMLDSPEVVKNRAKAKAIIARLWEESLMG
jgi:hypothetical protein